MVLAGGRGIFGRSGRFGTGPDPDVVRPNTPVPEPSWKGWTLGAVLLLGALVFGCVFVFKAANAAGLAGQPGTLTVEECSTEQLDNDREKVTCFGTFHPDDGSPPEYFAEMTVDSLLPQGEKIEVQQTGFGYVLVGAGETWNMAVGFFMMWIVAAVGLPFAATGIPPREQARAVTARITRNWAARPVKLLIFFWPVRIVVSLYAICRARILSTWVVVATTCLFLGGVVGTVVSAVQHGQ
jgi:hypothetical protein